MLASHSELWEGKWWLGVGLRLAGWYSSCVIYATGFDETNVIIHACKDFSLAQGLPDQSPSHKFFDKLSSVSKQGY